MQGDEAGEGLGITLAAAFDEAGSATGAAAVWLSADAKASSPEATLTSKPTAAHLDTGPA